LRRSLPHELVRRTQDIAIHLITREADGAVKPVSRSPRWFRKRLTGTFHIRDHGGRWRCCGRSDSDKLTPIPNLSIVFLLAVLFSAMNFGIWPAITHLCCRFWLTTSSLFPQCIR
jgi:two-component system sensor histidine kinase KdpD